jgi:hypothetical protein
MLDTYPNPWDFHNNGKTLLSSDNFHKVVYYDLNEIAMGAPIGGQCFLETTDKQKFKIHNWCGGPPAWETDGQLLAIPIWTRNFLKGTVQQIGLVDTKTKELKIFSKTFRVLDLRSFDKKVIFGYDSPIHKTTAITFDIEKEKIDTIINLTA